MTPPQHSTVLITGGTGGIGFHSAVGIAQTGARVLVTGRDVDRGEAAVQAIKDATSNSAVFFVQGDLSSISSIDRLATAVRECTQRIDVLVNNAGFLGDTLQTSDDGFEMHFAVNVLAPWRLSHALLPALKAAPDARVINVSGGDKPARIDPENLQAEKGFRGLMTYTHSKSALEAMSMALAKDFEPKGISVNVVFPGRASTAMTQSLTPKALPGAMKLMYPFFRLFFRDDGGKSAAKAAQSTIWAATSPELEGVTGAYFDTHSKRQELHPSAHEPGVQDAIRSTLGLAQEGRRPPAGD